MHTAYSGKLVNITLKALGYSSGHNKPVISLFDDNPATVISYFNYNQIYKRKGIPKDISERQSNKAISVYNITNDFFLALKTLNK